MQAASFRHLRAASRLQLTAHEMIVEIVEQNVSESLALEWAK